MKMSDHPGVTWSTFASGAALAVVVCGAGWTLFQDKFQAAKESDAEIRRHLTRIDDQLLVREHQFLLQEQFIEFKTRILDRENAMEKRLDGLEQTRPTTGELSGVSKSMEGTMSKLEERVRQLEKAPRIEK